MNVKMTIILGVAVAIALISSCETGSLNRSGFDLPVSEGATGESTTEVEFTVDALSLTGIVSAASGSVMAELLSPSGAVVFSVTVVAPGEMKVERSFPVEGGVWRLRYLSLNGTGYIRMHLNVIR